MLLYTPRILMMVNENPYSIAKMNVDAACNRSLDEMAVFATCSTPRCLLRCQGVSSLNFDRCTTVEEAGEALFQAGALDPHVPMAHCTTFPGFPSWRQSVVGH